jgi:hypothetical protein
MTGHNYGVCLKCGKTHIHPQGAAVLKGSHQTEAHKQHRADVLKGKKRPLISIKFFAEGNPNWVSNTTNQGTGRCRANRWYKIPKGLIRHHIDGNPLNNNPENIQIVTRSQHAKIHGFGKHLLEMKR